MIDFQREPLRNRFFALPGNAEARRVNNIHYLLRGNDFFCFIYGMVIVQVCVGTVGGVEGDDKAAFGAWLRTGKFQTVNKASRQNVTVPRVPHLQW